MLTLGLCILALVVGYVLGAKGMLGYLTSPRSRHLAPWLFRYMLRRHNTEIIERRG